MDPILRTLLLAAGLAFCGFFALLTISAALESRFDILTLVSLFVVVMIGAGLFGAIRNPPPDE